LIVDIISEDVFLFLCAVKYFGRARGGGGGKKRLFYDGSISRLNQSLIIKQIEKFKLETMIIDGDIIA